jgi:hypothetical protein
MVKKLVLKLTIGLLPVFLAATFLVHPHAEKQQSIVVPTADWFGGWQATDICSSIDQLGIEKQLNPRAYQILVACGRAPASPPDSIFTGGGDGSTALGNLGGVDQDVILGGEGTYPHVTQSETQTWTEGNTTVVAYNRSPTRSTSYRGASYYTDVGATFTPITPFCAGQGTNYGDPLVVYDKKHALWLVGFLATGCGGQGIGFWSSTDGVSWSATGCAHNGTSDDRESAWVDNNPSSSFYGRVYVTWNAFGSAHPPGDVPGNQHIVSVFSDDGGATWSNATFVEQSSLFVRNVQVAVGTDGTVFVAGMDEGGGGLNTRQNHVYRSSNGGVTWSGGAVGSRFAAPGSSTCGYFAAMFPSYWRHMGWGDVGAGPSGVISYAFAQHGTGADPGDIYYTRSADNGLTWSAAVKLNTDATTRAQWQPSLTVNPGGQVFVSWYDARTTTGNSYERWGRLSTDGGLTWATDDVLSDAPSPLPVQPDGAIQPCYAGDYDRSFADAFFAFGSWVDGRTPISGNSQQDVYFDKVALAPPCTTCPVLSATGYKLKGIQTADLAWTPVIAGDTVNVTRNLVFVTTTADDGAYTDSTGNKGNNASYVYQVCVVETGDCSNLVTVKFGSK